MNAAIHAQISCRAAKTDNEEDRHHFYLTHDFMDCSKEVEASSLHRALSHHLWFIKRVAIPIFGHTYVCKGGEKKRVNTKDDLEQNHCIADFRGQFLPNLSDYINLIEKDSTDEERFKSFEAQNPDLFANPEIKELLLSPLANTGMIESLWLTKNSWFIGGILPKIFPDVKIKLKDAREFSPSIFFNRMKFADWVDNGKGYPPSAAKILEYRNSKKNHKILEDWINPLSPNKEIQPKLVPENPLFVPYTPMPIFDDTGLHKPFPPGTLD